MSASNSSSSTHFTAATNQRVKGARAARIKCQALCSCYWLLLLLLMLLLLLLLLLSLLLLLLLLLSLLLLAECAAWQIC
jgi:hypothetical protein